MLNYILKAIHHESFYKKCAGKRFMKVRTNELRVWTVPLVKVICSGHPPYTAHLYTQVQTSVSGLRGFTQRPSYISTSNIPYFYVSPTTTLNVFWFALYQCSMTLRLYVLCSSVTNWHVRCEYHVLTWHELSTKLVLIEKDAGSKTRNTAACKQFERAWERVLCQSKCTVHRLRKH